MAMNRRRFLKNTAKGTSALVAAGVCPKALAQLPASPFLMFVHCDGGWDPTMVFDSHIGESIVAQESGAYNEKKGVSYVAHGDRPSVDDFFATYGNGCAIVNGIHTGSMSRIPATRNMLGAVPKNFNRQVDWMTYYAANMNPLATMPHLVIDGPYMPGEYASSTVFLKHKMLTEYITEIPDTETLGNEGEKALTTYLTARHQEILTNINTKSLDYEKLRAITAGYLRENTVQSQVGSTVANLGSQGSQSDLAYAGKVAVESFAAGQTQCATLRCGGPEAWDTSRNHFSRQNALFNDLFSSLKAILDHAKSKSIDGVAVSDRIILVVTSERGRNPHLNADGGKGPWSFTSAMLWGQGIRGGITVSGTDAALRGNFINPLVGEAIGSGDIQLTMYNVMAAIYGASGLSITKILKDHAPVVSIVESLG